MPGYSGTPLAQKLGIKPACRVALVNAPPKFESVLDALPDSATVCRGLRGRSPIDVILLFCGDQLSLHAEFAACTARLAQTGGLWVCWPKKSSGIPTDLTEDAIRSLGLTAGLVDNKVCAVTDIWSGLRFVIRLKDRKT